MLDSYDVIVVGGGMAGLYAAYAAKEKEPDATIALLTAGRLGTGGCSVKTHGLNAALAEGDDWHQHLEDTLQAGGQINDRTLASILCREVLDRVAELKAWGVTFFGLGEGHKVGNYGGSSHPRSIFWYDLTGQQIVQHLINRVEITGCHILDYRTAIDLIFIDDACRGIVAINERTGIIERYLCQSTILAAGGGACVYDISTITSDKMGAGIAMAFEIGAELTDMEMVQFHPTALVLPDAEGNGEPFEEELRMLGATLLNIKNERFMRNYDERLEAATRDVISQSIVKEVLAGRGTSNGAVFLDISTIEKRFLASRFPGLIRKMRNWGVDLLRENRFEIRPGAHFLMGGIKISEDAESTIRGLFACGEDAGGIHGANRLGGNGMADALVFGYRAGRAAAAIAAEKRTSLAEKSRLSQRAVSIPFSCDSITETQAVDYSRRIEVAMSKHLGVIRSIEGIEEAVEELANLERELMAYEQTASGQTLERAQVEDLRRSRILTFKLSIAQLIALSARERGFSLGAHFLSEDLETSSNFNTVIRREGSRLDVSRRTLPH